jgi:heme-degrading monooxygenase HmoA
MTTISANNRLTTAINTFSVAPEHQQKVVTLLTAAVNLLATTQPGFISATIHRSIDGKRVLNYVQWNSKQHFEAVFGNAEFMELYAEIKTIASPEPLLYEVVHTAMGTVPANKP